MKPHGASRHTIVVAAGILPSAQIGNQFALLCPAKFAPCPSRSLPGTAFTRETPDPGKIVHFDHRGTGNQVIVAI